MPETHRWQNDEAMAAALEAVLFASGEPVSLEELMRALGGVQRARLEGALERLRRVWIASKVNPAGECLKTTAMPSHIQTWCKRCVTMRSGFC